jgi:putative ABC transport system permease protein
MIGEVALSLILLLTAGLLLKSFGLLRGVDLGYQPDRVIAVRMFLPRAKYSQPAARIAFYDRVVERVSALPGVEFTAFASNLPLRGGWGGNLTLEHPPDAEHPDYQASFQLVSPDYFRALAVPLREGRLFTSDDRSGTLPVVIVNETTARRFWPKGNAVGSRLKKGGPSSMSPWRTVVGVVGDVRLWGPASPTPLEVYFPSGQYENLGISPSELVARTAGDPQLLVPAIRREIWSVDPEQPLSRVETLGQSVTLSVAQPRFNALLLLLFASLAVTLALLGIYGVVAYAVSQRTAEMGLRMALGAQPGELVQLVIRRVLGKVGIGIVLGTMGAYVGARFVEKLLFGVKPHDPATFASVMILLTLAALAASYIPARRIVRVDPVIALRYE